MDRLGSLGSTVSPQGFQATVEQIPTSAFRRSICVFSVCPPPDTEKSRNPLQNKGFRLFLCRQGDLNPHETGNHHQIVQREESGVAEWVQWSRACRRSELIPDSKG